ncbi:MAG: hypothetical protein ACOYOK_09200 [Pseudobdellovibrionaceae bacterium]
MFLVIDLHQLNQFTLPIVNQAFDLWKSVYSEILENAGEILVPDYFYKCKIISVIYENDIVQAFTLHNVYNLSANGVCDLSYFSPLNEFTKQKLKHEGHKVWTCEWVTVHPDFRGRFTKVQLGEVIMGLAFKLFAELDCTSAMGFSRKDIKADRMAEKFGFISIDTIVRHGIECGVMFLKKENLLPHPYEKTQIKIDSLYENKTIYSNILPSHTEAA